MLITNDNKTTSPFQTKGILLSHKNNSQSLFLQQKAIGKIFSLCRFLFSVPTSWVRCFFVKQIDLMDTKKQIYLSLAAAFAGQHVPDLYCAFVAAAHHRPSHTNAPSAINPLMSPHD